MNIMIYKYYYYILNLKFQMTRQYNEKIHMHDLNHLPNQAKKTYIIPT